MTSTRMAPSYYRPAPRAGSRLTGGARLDQAAGRARKRSLHWQIFFLLVAIVGSVLLYLIVIFPALVQYTGQLNSSRYVAPDRHIPPQMPLLNAPPSYTTEPTLRLTGFATPETQVYFILDGETGDDRVTTVGINGEFAASLLLSEGAHTLQAYSRDDEGLESTTTKLYTITLDTQTPEINLETPENRQEFIGRAQQTAVISGQTEAGAKVVVNTVAGTADADGFFQINYLLTEGSNELVVMASDLAGNEDQVTITVSYRP